MRLKSTMRNTLWNLIGQFFMILTGLVLKRVLLQSIGIENIGLNYLFNDIVALLSIAELGLIGIIAYHLFEPLATGNQTRVAQLMDFFKKAYALIGLVITIAGFALIPFLGYLVGETTLDFNCTKSLARWLA